MTRKKSRVLPTSSVSGTELKYNDGEWTAARFRSFVVSALRTATRRWPPKFKALKDAYIGRQVNKKTNKMAMHYACASCSNHFVAKDVQVDHIFPVVSPQTGFVDWETYISRLFCEKENLQVLCKPCHVEKTALEKLQRKDNGQTKENTNRTGRTKHQ
jgi:5-methylcytosine-specific restriction endonuclease McrA